MQLGLAVVPPGPAMVAGPNCRRDRGHGSGRGCQAMTEKVTVGAPGTSVPPSVRRLGAVAPAERLGFDAIWGPDHWMGWSPDGVWAPERFDIATRHSSPHVYLDAMVAIAAAAMRTESVRLGTAVS